jgi:tripartite-type tricarboxylate transporter receptor subunit TctC
MTDRRRFILRTTATVGTLASIGAPALAATWPSRPLRIVVPFPPGGTSDVIARVISKPLGDALGVNVIVENKTGANGSIGAAAVAQATDEHTLLLSDMSALAITPLVTKEMPYKPSELKGVTMLAYSPHLLVMHPSVQASNTDVRARMVGAGAEVMTSSPKETSDFLAGEARRWGAVIQRAGAQLEGNV